MNPLPLAGVRVVVVNNFPGPGLGGGEVQLLAVSGALVDAGAELAAVVVPGSGLIDPLEALGAEVRVAAMSPRRAFAVADVVASLAADAERVVVLGTGFFTNLLVRVARSRFERDVRRRRMVRVVNIVAVTPGASSTEGESSFLLGLRRLADTATASRVDAFVAVASAVAEGLAASGVPARRIRTIPNGIDPQVVRAAGQKPIDLPERDDRLSSVVCVARLSPVKGVEYLVRAAALVANARFFLVGDGPLEDELKRLAAELGVTDRVSFLGYVAPAAGVIATADLVVMPSLSEGLPLVALEAGALGRPVVASSVGGLVEVIEDGITGRLVPPGDYHALAAAIGEVLSDPSLAARMGAAARKRVEERYDARRMGAAYVDLVAGLVGKTP